MYSLCTKVITKDQDRKRLYLDFLKIEIHLVSVLSTLAEIDYNNRREAQLEGIARAKAEGKYKGRANGSELSAAVLAEKHSDIVKELNQGESIRRAARLTGKSKSTVQRVKKALEEIEQ